MQSYYKRCKHCGSKYTFRINGRRWGMEDYISDYCPECQKAIDDALKKRQIKFIEQWREIDSIRITEFVHWAKVSNLLEIDMSCYYYGYIITRGRKKYSISCNDNGEWKIYQWYYYDIIKKEFTDDYVECFDEDYIMKVFTSIKKEDVPAVEVEEPSNKFFWLDYIPPTEFKIEENETN